MKLTYISLTKHYNKEQSGKYLVTLCIYIVYTCIYERIYIHEFAYFVKLLLLASFCNCKVLFAVLIFACTGHISNTTKIGKLYFPGKFYLSIILSYYHTTECDIPDRDWYFIHYGISDIFIKEFYSARDYLHFYCCYSQFIIKLFIYFNLILNFKILIIRFLYLSLSFSYNRFLFSF